MPPSHRGPMVNTDSTDASSPGSIPGADGETSSWPLIPDKDRRSNWSIN